MKSRPYFPAAETPLALHPFQYGLVLACSQVVYPAKESSFPAGVQQGTLCAPPKRKPPGYFHRDLQGGDYFEFVPGSAHTVWPPLPPHS